MDSSCGPRLIAGIEYEVSTFLRINYTATTFSVWWSKEHVDFNFNSFSDVREICGALAVADRDHCPNPQQATTLLIQLDQLVSAPSMWFHNSCKWLQHWSFLQNVWNIRSLPISPPVLDDCVSSSYHIDPFTLKSNQFQISPEACTHLHTYWN